MRGHTRTQWYLQSALWSHTAPTRVVCCWPQYRTIQQNDTTFPWDDDSDALCLFSYPNESLRCIHENGQPKKAIILSALLKWATLKPQGKAAQRKFFETMAARYKINDLQFNLTNSLWIQNSLKASLAPVSVSFSLSLVPIQRFFPQSSTF